MLSIRPGELAF